MADNTLDSLVEWMKTGNPMRNWGVIVAVDREQANLLLMQEYIQRFSQTTYFPPVSGSVAGSVPEIREFIHNFVMDAPRLSFENADIDASKAMLTMHVLGGTHVTLQDEGDGWEARQISEYDPMQGPKLHLDLMLSEVGGSVTDDSRIRLDLANSDSFRLTYTVTDEGQRLGGEFFSEKFRALDPDQREYVLGHLESDPGASVRPKKFKLLTQKHPDPDARLDEPAVGAGAILTMIQLDGDEEGDTPPVTYRYLIPTAEGQALSATVLFDHYKSLPAIIPDFGEQLLERLAELIGGITHFEVIRENGRLISAKAKSGAVNFPSATHVIEKVPVPAPRLTDVYISYEAVSLPANGQTPLSMTRKGGTVWSVVWEATSTHNAIFRFDPDWDASYPRVLALDYFANLEAEYEVTEENGSPVFKATAFNLRAGAVPSAGLHEQGDDDDWRDWLFMMAFVYFQFSLMLQGLTAARVREKLELTFNFDISVDQVIDQFMKLKFGHVLQSDIVKLPLDLAAFGRIKPTLSVVPLEWLMSAGGEKTFNTAPSVLGVTWQATCVDPEGGPAGVINRLTGDYTAPQAAEISGRYCRVCITATSSEGSSSALVTVAANAVAINPLVTTCLHSTQVKLAAGHLGTGTLNWRIKDARPGESGALEDHSDGTCTYTATAPAAPAAKTYVIDEVEVTNDAGESRSMVLIAKQKTPALQVLVEGPLVANQPIQLRAMANGNPAPVEWTWIGPGSIDDSGLYQPDPTAAQPFMVAFAHIDGGWLGIMEGHLILPLPVTDYVDEIALLGQYSRVFP